MRWKEGAGALASPHEEGTCHRVKVSGPGGMLDAAQAPRAGSGASRNNDTSGRMVTSPFETVLARSEDVWGPTGRFILLCFLSAKQLASQCSILMCHNRLRESRYGPSGCRRPDTPSQSVAFGNQSWRYSALTSWISGRAGPSIRHMPDDHVLGMTLDERRNPRIRQTQRGIAA